MSVTPETCGAAGEPAEPGVGDQVPEGGVVSADGSSGRPMERPTGPGSSDPDGSLPDAAPDAAEPGAGTCRYAYLEVPSTSQSRRRTKPPLAPAFLRAGAPPEDGRASSAGPCDRPVATIPRRCLDLRRFMTMSRPQYKSSCSISSVTSVFNYLYGQTRAITQEEALRALGFSPPFGEIRFGPMAGNDNVMRWFTRLRLSYKLPGSCGLLYKCGGKNRTQRDLRGARRELVRGLQSDKMAFIYHCLNHYNVVAGYEFTPKEHRFASAQVVSEAVLDNPTGPLLSGREEQSASDVSTTSGEPGSEPATGSTATSAVASAAVPGSDRSDYCENANMWVIICDCSRGTPPIYSVAWSFVEKDLTSRPPYCWNLRHPERGLLRKVKGVYESVDEKQVGDAWCALSPVSRHAVPQLAAPAPAGAATAEPAADAKAAKARESAPPAQTFQDEDDDSLQQDHDDSTADLSACPEEDGSQSNSNSLSGFSRPPSGGLVGSSLDVSGGSLAGQRTEVSQAPKLRAMNRATCTCIMWFSSLPKHQAFPEGAAGGASA